MYELWRFRFDSDQVEDFPICNMFNKCDKTHII